MTGPAAGASDPAGGIWALDGPESPVSPGPDFEWEEARYEHFHGADAGSEPGHGNCDPFCPFDTPAQTEAKAAYEEWRAQREAEAPEAGS